MYGSLLGFCVQKLTHGFRNYITLFPPYPVPGRQDMNSPDGGFFTFTSSLFPPYFPHTHPPHTHTRWKGVLHTGVCKIITLMYRYVGHPAPWILWVYWDSHNTLNFFPKSRPAIFLLCLLKPFLSLTLLPSLNFCSSSWFCSPSHFGGSPATSCCSGQGLSCGH